MLNILQLQTKVLSSKEQTLNYIEAYLKKFLHLQPDIVTLPEMFTALMIINLFLYMLNSKEILLTNFVKI